MAHPLSALRPQLPRRARPSGGDGAGSSFPASRRTSTSVHQRARGSGSLVVQAGGFQDPDELRRIEKNKRWKRTDPEEKVWDIEEQRAASTYKREALEAMLRLQVDDRPDPLKPRQEVYLCGECESIITTSEDAVVVAGKHKHTLNGGLGPVDVAVFSEAEGALDALIQEMDAPEWETPREALGCRCAKCKAHLGWSYRASAGDDGDFKAIQLNRVKLQ
eukprot:CAMPEP_0117670200 /NCGR_PEP_ID=MMETSP0804-20121206/12602_1 /TAXON_ID=1074897 /ORGANISM="Tetraselmis astigmatica, Strain CCMP880" /LENGTH=218 /DNA_ID=CAMNT_0005478435 /DNA_START=166 /DNA_END=822 /DNA_ORIENTATION=+